MRREYLLLTITLVLCTLAGWWLTRDAVEPSDTETGAIASRAKNNPPPIIQSRAKKLTERLKGDRSSSLEDLIAIKGERLVRFATDEAYQNALRRLDGSGFTLLGQIDRFRVLRLGVTDLDALRDWLGDEGEDAPNYLVSLPIVPDPEASDGGVSFGTSSFDFLNLTGDNSTWGEGVKVAIIDTGVDSHLTLGDRVQRIDIASLGEGAEQHGHGTAVASVIGGEDSRLPGIAPASPLLSIRVADETGNSNSFLLAEGIIAAVENGAPIINISMGSYGDSSIVRDAIKYAQESGAAVVVSVGNEGFDFPAYPAGYEGVISVGAIDATGAYMSFSNQSNTLSLTAPGVGVLAAWPGDRAINFSGTSASAPFVSGTLAAIISESPYQLNGAQAAQILLNYTNDAGYPGYDTQYGNGYLDVGRIMQRDTAGIQDIAIASHYYETGNSPYGTGLQISVENRGTESLFNSQLNVSIAGNNYPLNIPSLSPNQREVITIPAGYNTIQSTGQLSVSSSVNLSNGGTDALPRNNQRAEILTLPSSGNGP